MWSLAEVLLAEPPDGERSEYQCEACNVLFLAATAVEAFQKAVKWGLDYAAEPPSGMRLLGVSHLTTVGDEIGDGTEICGRFFRAEAVWQRASELVPPPEQLKAIQWESGADRPVGDLLNAESVELLKRVWGYGGPT